MNEDAKSFAASETGERTPEAKRLDVKDMEQVAGGRNVREVYFCMTCGEPVTTWDEHRMHVIQTRLIPEMP